MSSSDNNATSAPLLIELGFGKSYVTQIIKMLETTRIFSDLTIEELKLLAQYMHAYTANTGTKLFREGEHDGNIFVLIEGRLEVHKEISAGNGKILADIRPGRLIGEMAAVDGLPNSASVIAAEPSTLVMISSANLHKICDELPGLGIKIIWKLADLLSQRLRLTSGRLVNFL